MRDCLEINLGKHIYQENACSHCVLTCLKKSTKWLKYYIMDSRLYNYKSKESSCVGLVVIYFCWLKVPHGFCLITLDCVCFSITLLLWWYFRFNVCKTLSKADDLYAFWDFSNFVGICEAMSHFFFGFC